MSACCEHSCSAPGNTPSDDPIWRRVLWAALIINASMFAVEMASGIAAGSSSLKADALDFLGDSANYAISLGVTGLALQWRARAALLKGGTLLLLGIWVAGSTVWHATRGTLPSAEVMGAVGAVALFANLLVAVLLYRFRGGDANRRSAWICSRNDAIGNVAVILAAAGVFGSGRGWPDIVVAGIMSALALSGGIQILRQAYSELEMEVAGTPAE